MTRTIRSPNGREAYAHGRLFRLAIWRNKNVRLVNNAYLAGDDQVIDVWHVCPKQRTPSWFWRAPRVRFPFWTAVLSFCRPLRALGFRKAAERLGDLVWDRHWACVSIEPRETWAALFWRLAASARPSSARLAELADEAGAASLSASYRHERAWKEGWTD